MRGHMAVQVPRRCQWAFQLQANLEKGRYMVPVVQNVEHSSSMGVIGAGSLCNGVKVLGLAGEFRLVVLSVSSSWISPSSNSG